MSATAGAHRGCKDYPGHPSELTNLGSDVNGEGFGGVSGTMEPCRLAAVLTHVCHGRYLGSDWEYL